MYVKTGTGLRIDNPKWEAIVKILRTLPNLPNDHNYMVYEASNEPCSYIQARPEEGKETFNVEYRDGKAKRHFARDNICFCEVVVMFRSYHIQDNKWRKMGEWEDISQHFTFDS